MEKFCKSKMNKAQTSGQSSSLNTASFGHAIIELVSTLFVVLILLFICPILLGIIIISIIIYGAINMKSMSRPVLFFGIY
jgi:hypothetical protein